MLDVIVALMYTGVVIISILLIALILVQPAKGGDFGSAFGGVGESVFGAHTMGHLSKITIALLSVFFVLTLGLAVLAGHKAKGGGLEDSLVAKRSAASAAAVKPERKPDVPAPLPAKNIPAPVKSIEKKPVPAKVPAAGVKAPAVKAPVPAKKPDAVKK